MTVYRDRRTDLYRYDFMIAGTRYTKRGFKTRRTAGDSESDRRKALKAGLTDPFPTFRELVGAFLTTSLRSKSPQWAKQLEWKLNKGFENWETLHPREITPGHVEKALNRLRSAGNSARSVNEYRKIAKAVLNFGIKMGALERNPADAVEKMPEDQVPVEPIPKADLQKLILAAEGTLRALLIFLSQTGARWIEAARLRHTDLHLDGPRPFCVLRTRKTRGRGERPRPQPLSTLAVQAVNSTPSYSSGHVFPGPSGGVMVYNTELKRFQALCERLKLPKYSFHQVRHFVGAVATSMGKSKKAVALMLGHSDTAATERYMHADDPELWEVVRRVEAEMAEAAISADGEAAEGGQS